MKLIYKEKSHTIINLGFIKLKFNLKYKTNKIFILQSDGSIKQVRRPPGGVKVNFHGENSEITFFENSNFKNCFFDIHTNCKVQIGHINDWKAINLYASCEDNSRLSVGNDFNCAGVIILCGFNSSITIGNKCMLSNNITIRSTDQHPIYDLTTNECINKPKSVCIGDKVWICKDVNILKGVKIANNVVIANGAVVTKSISKSNTIYAGIPAVEVKTGIYWEKEFSAIDKEINIG